jgi:hypothetical protein
MIQDMDYFVVAMVFQGKTFGVFNRHFFREKVLWGSSGVGGGFFSLVFAAAPQRQQAAAVKEGANK